MEGGPLTPPPDSEIHYPSNDAVVTMTTFMADPSPDPSVPLPTVRKRRPKRTGRYLTELSKPYLTQWVIDRGRAPYKRERAELMEHASQLEGAPVEEKKLLNFCAGIRVKVRRGKIIVGDDRQENGSEALSSTPRPPSERTSDIGESSQPSATPDLSDADDEMSTQYAGADENDSEMHSSSQSVHDSDEAAEVTFAPQAYEERPHTTNQVHATVHPTIISPIPTRSTTVPSIDPFSKASLSSELPSTATTASSSGLTLPTPSPSYQEQSSSHVDPPWSFHHPTSNHERSYDQVGLNVTAAQTLAHAFSPPLASPNHSWNEEQSQRLPTPSSDEEIEQQRQLLDPPPPQPIQSPVPIEIKQPKPRRFPYPIPPPPTITIPTVPPFPDHIPIPSQQQHQSAASAATFSSQSHHASPLPGYPANSGYCNTPSWSGSADPSGGLGLSFSQYQFASTTTMTTTTAKTSASWLPSARVTIHLPTAVGGSIKQSSKELLIDTTFQFPLPPPPLLSLSHSTGYQSKSSSLSSALSTTTIAMASRDPNRNGTSSNSGSQGHPTQSQSNLYAQATQQPRAPNAASRAPNAYMPPPVAQPDNTTFRPIPTPAQLLAFTSQPSRGSGTARTSSTGRGGTTPPAQATSASNIKEEASPSSE